MNGVKCGWFLFTEQSKRHEILIKNSFQVWQRWGRSLNFELNQKISRIFGQKWPFFSKNVWNDTSDPFLQIYQKFGSYSSFYVSFKALFLTLLSIVIFFSDATFFRQIAYCARGQNINSAWSIWINTVHICITLPLFVSAKKYI